MSWKFLRSIAVFRENIITAGQWQSLKVKNTERNRKIPAMRAETFCVSVNERKSPDFDYFSIDKRRMITVKGRCRLDNFRALPISIVLMIRLNPG